MIVVDTNVLSQTFQKSPSERVLLWLDALEPGDGALCAPVANELFFIAELHAMRHGSDRIKRQLTRIVDAKFAQPVLPFDARAADVCAFVRAQQVVRGRSRPVLDMMIAAIAMTNQLPLATGNVKDFEGLGLPLVNPFEAS